jgi:hypothetical protein
MERHVLTLGRAKQPNHEGTMQWIRARCDPSQQRGQRVVAGGRELLHGKAVVAGKLGEREAGE